MADKVGLQTLQLEDGKRLAHMLYGELLHSSHQAFFFHGLQSCHREAAQLSCAAKFLRLRLIAVDRPGTGQSSPSVDRHVLDWPHRVERLAAHVGLDSVSIIAVSGDGPYALACAEYSPADRLRGISLVASVAPAWELGTYGLRSNLRISTILAQWFPVGALAALLDIDRQYGLAACNPDQSILAEKVEASLVGLDDASRQELLKPASLAATVAGLRAAYSNGSIEVAREMQLVARGWGLRLSELNYAGRIDVHISSHDCVCQSK